MAVELFADQLPRAASKRSSEVNRLLRAAMGPTLLGEPVQMDFYARNGFRFLAVPAWVDSASLTLRAQQFRNIVRLDATRARDHAIRTIADGHLDAETMLSAVARLENPRHRFSAELFWPHLPENEFSSIRNTGELGSVKVIQEFSNGTCKGVQRAHRMHVRALALHCLAIDMEFSYLEQRCAVPDGRWEAAITAWRELWSHDAFWDYMHKRGQQMDDPRLQKEDADKARSELPRVILGLHELLAEKYAASERYQDCQRHLSLITQSGFPQEIARASTWNAVKGVAGTKLEDLCQRTRKDFDVIKERTGRANFERLVKPLLQEAGDIQNFLTERLHLPEVYLEQSAFDRFAMNLKESTDKKIEYDDGERERNLLYSSTVLKRLLALPLSSQVRREISQAIQEDNRHLYSQFDIDSGALPQALQCFFLSGAEADPDESIVIPMYRVTDRQVEVNRIQGNAGISVRFNRARLLIPRSKQAKPAHGGTVEVPVPPAQFSPRQRDVATQLKSLEGKQGAAQAERTRHRNLAIQAEEASQLADLEARTKGFNDRIDGANGAIERLKKEKEEEIASRNKEMNMQLARIDAQHAPTLDIARTQQANAQASLAGLAGVAKIELPVAFFILLIASSSLGFGMGDGILAVIGAVVLGKIVRAVIRARANAPLAKAEEAHSRDRETCQKESEAICKGIIQKFAEKSAKFKSVLDAVAQEKTNLKEAGRKRIEEMRKRWDDQITKAATEFEQSTKSLRAQLVIKSRVKKLEQQSDFPAYQAARKKDFREGEKPPASEMKLTAAERTQAFIMMSR